LRIHGDQSAFGTFHRQAGFQLRVFRRIANTDYESATTGENAKDAPNGTAQARRSSKSDKISAAAQFLPINRKEDPGPRDGDKNAFD